MGKIQQMMLHVALKTNMLAEVTNAAGKSAGRIVEMTHLASGTRLLKIVQPPVVGVKHIVRQKPLERNVIQN